MSSQIVLSNITPMPTFDALQFAALNEAWRITALQLGLAGILIGLAIGIYFGYCYGRSK